MDTRVDWTRASAGSTHTCGLRTNGRAYCWGWNISGQIGDTTLIDRHSPAEAGSLYDPWTTVDSGSDHACAVRSNHALHCWGFNNRGQLGVGDLLDRNTPTREAVGYATWVTVGGGKYHSCGLRTNKTLYCWGYNFYGQLGLGDNVNRDAPQLIP